MARCILLPFCWGNRFRKSIKTISNERISKRFHGPLQDTRYGRDTSRLKRDCLFFHIAFRCPDKF